MTIHINIEAANADDALAEMECLLQGRSSQKVMQAGIQQGPPVEKPAGVSEENPSVSPPESDPSESESEDPPMSKTAKKKASKKKASKKKTAKKTETSEPEGNGEVSLDDVMAMGKKVHATFGMNTIRDLIESHGGENLSSIPPDNRAAFMEACQAQLDQGE